MARDDNQSLRQFLRGVPIFGGLEGRRLDSVISILGEDTFSTGSTIFKEGELGRTMYVLAEGEVEVLRSSAEGTLVPIVKLGPGEVFGEMALVELQPRSATVRVSKKARTFTLTNPDLYYLYKEDNYAYVLVLQNICRMLSRRLRKADSRIAEFLTRTSMKPTRPLRRARR
ncbi:MAG: cyclic nucleotide-binding domain-containing protein [Myxococcota bacterium]